MPRPMHVVNTQGLVIREGRYLMIVRGELEEQAPGALSPPGGKAEHGDDQTGVLESTLRREILEETGVKVGEMAYIQSSRFRMDSGTPVIDAAFLCKYESGEAYRADPDEVGAVDWLTFDEIISHPKTQPWTQETVRAAEALRVRLGW